MTDKYEHMHICVADMVRFVLRWRPECKVYVVEIRLESLLKSLQRTCFGRATTLDSSVQLYMQVGPIPSQRMLAK